MPLPAHPRIAFLASPTPDAQAALSQLLLKHQQHAPEDADVICALGGDGFMLQTLHKHGARGLPVFGMKLGTVGFLMNQHNPSELLARLHAAEPAVLRPLEMTATHEAGVVFESLAYNEVSLLRQTRQTAHLRIHLNGQVRLDELVCGELIGYGHSLVFHVINGDTVLQYTKPQIGGGVVNGCDPAVKIDGKPLKSGYIALQSEGHGIEFREIKIKKLE